MTLLEYLRMLVIVYAYTKSFYAVKLVAVYYAIYCYFDSDMAFIIKSKDELLVRLSTKF